MVMIAHAPALVLLSYAIVCASARDALDKPNIVMLFVDDLGYGDVGFNGHPTTSTPNINKLAYGGKVLSSWYSGCPVCSGSRAALMTGRQFTRSGVPGVFSPTVSNGLPLNESTVADQLKKAGYATAAMGKWHLGQRPMFLPGARGFDYYMGIPYSDDMGAARRTDCVNASRVQNQEYLVDALEQPLGLYQVEEFRYQHDGVDATWQEYVEAGYTDASDPGPAPITPPHFTSTAGKGVGLQSGPLLPLVYQSPGGTHPGNKNTSVLEQPLDFTNLADKYKTYVEGFIKDHSSSPFFLYMPFSHVHTTENNQPEGQYAGCLFRNTSRRGMFGDALAEVDWIVGGVVDTLKAQGVSNNTLILFTGDNGPWMSKGKSGGSEGLFTGRYSGYWNTGKGSTWEGGIHEAGFAHWPGVIAPNTRSAEVVSSMDLFPTATALAGLSLPADRVYDGRDMTDVLLDRDGGKSKHDFLFFYGGAGNCNRNNKKGPTAVRYGKWKAHYGTGPGLGGGFSKQCYPDVPLLFNIEEDPSEAYPLVTDNKMPSDPTLAAVITTINGAYDHEQATFEYGHLSTPPLLPDESKFKPGICCDATKDGGSKAVADATCDCNGAPYSPEPSSPTPSPKPMSPTPALTPVPAANYIGCFVDHQNHRCDLNATVQAGEACANEDPHAPGPLPHKVKMSVEVCNKFCQKYEFFGLQNGDACHCGNSYGTMGNSTENQCSAKCTGAAHEQCGGPNRNSVWRALLL